MYAGTAESPDVALALVLRLGGDERTAGEPVLHLPSLYADGSITEEITDSENPIFLIPGIEGGVQISNILVLIVFHVLL